jgi:predicted RNA binding protein YcfA (HicA-like mRNA interferase family)
MPKLPRPTGAEMVRFLESQGFRVVRIRGSHHVLARGELRTVIPVHGAEVLRIGTLRGVLRDTRISPAEFEVLWTRR